MNARDQVHSDIADRVARLLASQRGGARFYWLTFFIRLPGERTSAVWSLLESFGLERHGEHSMRFVYAKAQIARNAVAIGRLIARVSAACADNGAQVIAIDLDETRDEHPTKVVNLYCMP